MPMSQLSRAVCNPQHVSTRIFHNNTHKLSTCRSCRSAPRTRVRAHASAVASPNTAIAESRTLLEWPQICQQVACFCTTIMGAQQVLEDGLPEGRDVESCDTLMQETEEAMLANLSFPAAFDLRPALEAAQKPGFILNGQQLQGFRSTMEVAFASRRKLVSPGHDAAPAFPALATLAEGINPQDQNLLAAIQQCIQLGEVTDEASEQLAEVRRQRRGNLEELRRVVEGAAAAMKAVGASEEGTTSIIRDRFCVAVKAGRQGELGKGAMRLGASSSGATLYVEPPAAVALNNQEALLREQEAIEEAAVLSLLTRLVRDHSASLEALVNSIAALDIATARAQHARWLGSTRPALRREASGPPSTSDCSSTQSSSGTGSKLYAPGARHPVLMQPALSPLPYPPSAQDFRFDRNFQEAPAWERDSPALTGSSHTERGTLPRPLDLRLPVGKQVVAITGPNTGGKTATLKTVGALALMIKAGLFWPCDPEAVQRDGRPYAVYFDQVLADLGDSQSLQQNLSTFSGHIRRVNQILQAVTPQSLVLLDEVGSGTDPVEGAALARSILDTLRSRVALTVATTHHAELKSAPQEDPLYGNVSMEFDIQTLRPTYRLQWGEAGASNALDIAQSLGFDSQVVADARKVVAKGQEALAVGGGVEEVLAGLRQQLEGAKVAAQGTRVLGQATRSRVEALKAELKELRRRRDMLKGWEAQLGREKARIRQELETGVQQFAVGMITRPQVEEVFRKSNQEVMKKL